MWVAGCGCVPGHGRKRRRRYPDGPSPASWAARQKPIGAWGWEARRPAGWISNSENETDPHETVQGSAPIERSETEKTNKQVRHELSKNIKVAILQ